MGSIFLSHNSADKPFVNKLASDIRKHGHYAWVDRAEIKLGDSLLGKIEEGIANTDFLGVVLSSRSVRSEWVTREVQAALSQEIYGRRVKVLPILLEKVEIPLFLLDKMYADFTEEGDYDSALGLILERLSEPESGIGKTAFCEGDPQCSKGKKEYGGRNAAHEGYGGHGAKIQINIIEKNEGIVAGDGMNINHIHRR